MNTIMVIGSILSICACVVAIAVERGGVRRQRRMEREFQKMHTSNVKYAWRAW